MKLPEGSIHINGEVTEYETSIYYPLGYRETTVTIRESVYELMHPQARCNPIFKEEKEDKSMSVKIKKQPREITLEELKQGEEYERVTIHIDEDKKHEIENKYGIHYGFLPVMNFNDAEFDFKEHYLMIDSNSNKKIPYEIISKIEVVEK